MRKAINFFYWAIYLLYNLIKVVVKRACNKQSSIIKNANSLPEPSITNQRESKSYKNLTPTQPEPSSTCKVSPPRRRVDIIRDPTPEPIIKRIVTRLQTPEPDIIERVLMIIFNY